MPSTARSRQFDRSPRAGSSWCSAPAVIATGPSVFRWLRSDNPRTEDPERILDDLAEGIPDTSYERVADRREAIRLALATARTGDTVVLAGKGHETYQVIGTEHRAFDERAVVRECLEELGVA